MADLYTFVAGAALEQDTLFNLKCNCGGNAPVVPKSVAGFGYGKKGGAMKIVAQLDTKCPECAKTIRANVIEGDPGYVLTSNGGVESLMLPQGSTSAPVSDLSDDEQLGIINQMKKDVAKHQREKLKRELEKKKNAKKKRDR